MGGKQRRQPTLGTMLRESRLRHGWTSKEAAYQLGLVLGEAVTKSRYRYIEEVFGAKEGLVPDAKLFHAICDLFGWQDADVLARLMILRRW